MESFAIIILSFNYLCKSSVDTILVTDDFKKAVAPRYIHDFKSNIRHINICNDLF